MKFNSVKLIDKITEDTLSFYFKSCKAKNGRYRSWEHCYTVFKKARGNNSDIDFLCLHLSFYLASWGMYRGSSFLLQRDYLIHKDAIKIILDAKYNSLFGAPARVILDKIPLLFELRDSLATIYDSVRESVCKEDKEPKRKMQISDTLLSKILMGTMGCVPAYDRFFIQGIRENGIANGQFNENSIKKLCEHYLKNGNSYESIRQYMRCDDGTKYPQMKVLDMAFWNYSVKK